MESAHRVVADATRVYPTAPSFSSKDTVWFGDAHKATLLFLQPRWCKVIMMTRIMQSEIGSPCSCTCCSHLHASTSTGIRPLPFGKRRRACSRGNSTAIKGAALLGDFN